MTRHVLLALSFLTLPLGACSLSVGSAGSPDGDLAAPECSGEGCACYQEGAVRTCYAEPRIEGDVMICGIGVEECEGGRITACGDIVEEERPIPAGGIATRRCNPCRPDCFVNETEFDNDGMFDEGVNALNVDFDAVAGGGILHEGPTISPPPEGSGPAVGMPWDGDEANGIAVDPSDGALVLQSNSVNTNYIWIANTGQGTISRFDVDTFAETGRYWVAPPPNLSDADGLYNNDPSRTSINSAGDAFVAGRRGNTITRISVLNGFCPDTNGDGTITTSMNGTALPWIRQGSRWVPGDDCILWHVRNPTSGGTYLRAVAAQDVVDPITGDVNERVWVGAYNGSRMALLDGHDGSVLLVTNAPVNPYGFALDRAGNLWISSRRSTFRLGRVDTNRCNEYGCSTSICWDPSTNDGRCDGAVKQSIRNPNGAGYGVTVDFNQRVWLGGQDLAVYTPWDPPRSRWVRSNIGWSCCRPAGIAADGAGNVWASSSIGFYRVEMANPRRWTRFTTGQVGRGWGAAIDSRGKAWMIGRWENRAYVAEANEPPSGNLRNVTWRSTASSVRSPYTYSDMTGEQLRIAATQRGTFLQRFEGCAENTQWEDLVFNVETPPQTRVFFRVRTAASAADLPTAPWSGVGGVPGATSPIDLEDFFRTNGIIPQQYLDVEVALNSDASPTSFVSPRVHGFSVNYSCPTYVPGYYGQVVNSLESCVAPEQRPNWNEINWRIATPGATSAQIFIKPATTEAEARNIDPVNDTFFIIQIPPEADDTLATGSGIDISDAFEALGLPHKEYFLGIGVVMQPSPDMTGTPILSRMDVDYTCEDNI